MRADGRSSLIPSNLPTGKGAYYSSAGWDENGAGMSSKISPQTEV